MIPPGSVIGILGGGQLGRMTAMAAARLGYRCHILAPEAGSPAGDVAWRRTRTAYDDEAGLTAFADSVDVVTLEFENVPVAALETLAGKVPVRPSARVLAIAQDRLREKTFLGSIDVPVAAWHPVTAADEAAAAARALAGPAILKTARFGYDGKGQAPVADADGAPAAWATLKADRAILERRVDFAMELSVIVARSPDGAMACYDPVENRHRDHILHQTLAPAAIPAATAEEARAIGFRIAEALELEGIVGVEMFLERGDGLLVNELAPRPHNSGHWSIDACHVSQFEQLVRAVCGLPLGPTDRFADAVMTNLLGGDVESWPEILAEPGARLHLYGKDEVRPGRKMGHVTRLEPPAGVRR